MSAWLTGKMRDDFFGMCENWKVHRQRELATRLLRRTMAAWLAGTLRRCFFGMYANWLLNLDTSSRQHGISLGLDIWRHVLSRIMREELRIVFIRIRLHWDVERIPLLQAHGMVCQFEDLSVSSLRCLLSNHIFRQEQMHRAWLTKGETSPIVSGVDWTSAVDAIQKMSYLEIILQEHYDSEFLFQQQLSGLAFMRNLMAQYDVMDHEISREHFQGSFFVFDAARMKSLQDTLHQGRIVSDAAVLQEFREKY